MNYEQRAMIAYANDSENKLHKAISAGKLIDNRLKKEYGTEGATDCHFDQASYEAYFSYEALGRERNKLLQDEQ